MRRGPAVTSDVASARRKRAVGQIHRPVLTSPCYAPCLAAGLPLRQGSPRPIFLAKQPPRGRAVRDAKGGRPASCALSGPLTPGLSGFYGLIHRGTTGSRMRFAGRFGVEDCAISRKEQACRRKNRAHRANQGRSSRQQSRGRCRKRNRGRSRSRGRCPTSLGANHQSLRGPTSLVPFR